MVVRVVGSGCPGCQCDQGGQGCPVGSGDEVCLYDPGSPGGPGCQYGPGCQGVPGGQGVPVNPGGPCGKRIKVVQVKQVVKVV